MKNIDWLRRYANGKPIPSGLVDAALQSRLNIKSNSSNDIQELHDAISSEHYNPSKEEFDKLLEEPSRSNIFAYTLAKNPNIDDYKFNKLLDSGKLTMSGYDNLAGNKKLKPHHIDKLMDMDISKYEIAENQPNLTNTHIDRLIDRYKENLSKNKNLSKYGVDMVMGKIKDPFEKSDNIILANLAKNDKLEVSHIDNILSDPRYDDNWNLPAKRYMLRNSSKLTDNHIDNIINSPDADSHNSLSYNKKLSSHHIDKLINTGIPSITNNFAYREDLKDHHIDKLMQFAENDDNLMENLSSNKNLKEHHVDRVMQSGTNYALEQISAYNPNLKKRHIDELVSMNNNEINSRLKENPVYTKYQRGELE